MPGGLCVVPPRSSKLGGLQRQIDIIRGKLRAAAFHAFGFGQLTSRREQPGVRHLVYRTLVCRLQTNLPQRSAAFQQRRSDHLHFQPRI